MYLRPLTRSLIPVLTLVGLCADQAFGSSSLIFPRISFDENTFTGIAFVNPNPQPALITLTLYGEDGEPAQHDGFTNPAQLQVPPEQQIAKTVEELFSGALQPDRVGWMHAVGDLPGITGFFLYLDGAITLFDGADLPEADKKIVFHQVRHGGGYSTELNIVNPGDTPASLTLELRRPEQAPLVREIDEPLPARGVLRFSATDRFGLAEVPDGSYLVALSTANVAGFKFVRREGRDILGMNARPATQVQEHLYFPQLAVLGPWKTELGVINLSNAPVILSIHAFQQDGTLYSGEQLQGTNPTVHALEAGGSLFGDVAELFEFVGDDTLVGWLKVEATAPAIDGFVSYGVPDSGSVATVTSQPTARNRALFSHIATTFGYFTGVALLNPGQIANDYRVLASSAGGDVLGAFDGVLQPGERTSRLITELVPDSADLGGGFIWVKSSQPMYMTSLFGTASGESDILANIPPQIAPQGYNPDAGLPSLKLHPPLAVVQPSKQTQFSAQAQGGGGGPVTWKVNGVAGGNAGIGTIATTGPATALYTAPGDIPQPLPVTVSAETANLMAGASIDVLDKETLFQGIGLIQSVAYLRSLQRLFTAELIAAGGTAAADAGLGPSQTTDTTIRQALPLAPVPIRNYPGEEISKMIAFRASDGREYLLLASRSDGRILRLDPESGDSVEVVAGLDAPASMVFDPATGNLLVADAEQIWSFPRIQLEAGLATAGTQAASVDAGPTAPRVQVGNIQDARGVSVDACGGRIYVSEASGILEIDRLTGERRNVGGEFDATGQILGLYRREIPCPNAFQLLVADREAAQVALLGPREDFRTAWVGEERADDLAYLPILNHITGQSGILVVEELPDEAASVVSLVRVPDLYVERQANIGPTTAPGSYSDPRGDTFGEGERQVDLLEVSSLIDDASHSLVIDLTFAEPVRLANDSTYPEPTEVLAGFVDLDTDRDPQTGTISAVDLFSTHASGLGVDYFVDLGGLDPVRAAAAPIFRTSWRGRQEEVGTAPLSLLDNGLTLRVSIPLEAIGSDGRLHFAVAVGNQAEMTDVAPNGGYLSTESVQ
jgi:hypothetical protein